MEFHVTNTFLQTFILIGVGYMSLFFDVDNFTDRIMVTLTTLLVVATMGSSIQSVRSPFKGKLEKCSSVFFPPDPAKDVLLQAD